MRSSRGLRGFLTGVFFAFGAAGFLVLRRRGLAAVLDAAAVGGGGGGADWLGVGRDDDGCAEDCSADVGYEVAAALLLTAPNAGMRTVPV